MQALSHVCKLSVSTSGLSRQPRFCTTLFNFTMQEKHLKEGKPTVGLAGMR